MTGEKRRSTKDQEDISLLQSTSSMLQLLPLRVEGWNAKDHAGILPGAYSQNWHWDISIYRGELSRGSERYEIPLR